MYDEEGYSEHGPRWELVPFVLKLKVLQWILPHSLELGVEAEGPAGPEVVGPPLRARLWPCLAFSPSTSP